MYDSLASVHPQTTVLFGFVYSAITLTATPKTRTDALCSFSINSLLTDYLYPVSKYE